MIYRELAEMIEVLLTEEQKDQQVTRYDNECGVCQLHDLKVSNKEYINHDWNGRKIPYPTGTAYLSSQIDSEDWDEFSIE